MKRDQLKAECTDSLEWAARLGMPPEQASVILVIPKGWKPPRKFPRGELLLERNDDTRVRRYPAKRLLAWVEANWEMLPA